MNPEQITELIKVIFFGIASLCIPVATAYVIIGAARAKRAEEQSMRNAAHIQTVSTQIDGLLVQRDAAKVAEGAAAQAVVGEREAMLLAQGQREGRDHERDRLTQSKDLGVNKETPISVADDRTAKAAEITAQAATETALATGRIATEAEKKKK